MASVGSLQNEMQSLLVSVLSIPQDNLGQTHLCHELLFILNNHQLALNRLDLRYLDKPLALDKLTKRLIELVLEGQRQLCITVLLETTTGGSHRTIRQEILHFLRLKLKSTVKIFNEGKLDGLIVLQLSNSPQLLASLSRQNLQHNNHTTNESYALSTVTSQHTYHPRPSDKQTTQLMQAIVELSPDTPSSPDNVEECDEQLIEWSIEPSSNDWLVRVLPSCATSIEHKNVRTLSLLIELLKPFILGALGGYCNHVRLRVHDHTPAAPVQVTDSAAGKQIMNWLAATSLQFDPDQPQKGSILIHNLSDSLKRVQLSNQAIEQTSKSTTDCTEDSSDILEQLLHILDVDGYDFEPIIDHERRARSHEHLPQTEFGAVNRSQGQATPAIKLNGAMVQASKSDELTPSLINHQYQEPNPDTADRDRKLPVLNTEFCSSSTQTEDEIHTTKYKSPVSAHDVSRNSEDVSVSKTSMKHENTQTDCATWQKVEWQFENLNLQHGCFILLGVFGLMGAVVAYVYYSLKQCFFK